MTQQTKDLVEEPATVAHDYLKSSGYVD